MGEKKITSAPVVLAVIVFAIGLGLGYYLWGIQRKGPTDYKEMLSKTIDYIATIEHKNQTLLKTIDTLENEVDVLKKESKGVPVELESRLKDLKARVDSLQHENQQLKQKLITYENMLKENQALKKKGAQETKPAQTNLGTTANTGGE